MWGLRLLISRWAFRFFLLVWVDAHVDAHVLVSCVYRPTWDAGTQSHEGDGRDRVFETDGAAHLGRQVANDGRQSPDQQYGHDEGHVTVRHVYIRHTQNSSQVVFFSFKQMISIICHKKKNRLDNICFNPSRLYHQQQHLLAFLSNHQSIAH